MDQYDTAAKSSDLEIKLNFLGRQKLLPLKINDIPWQKAERRSVRVSVKKIFALVWR